MLMHRVKSQRAPRIETPKHRRLWNGEGPTGKSREHC